MRVVLLGLVRLVRQSGGELRTHGDLLYLPIVRLLLLYRGRGLSLSEREGSPTASL